MCSAVSRVSGLCQSIRAHAAAAMATTLPRKTHFSALQMRQRAQRNTLPSCFRGAVTVTRGVTRKCRDAIKALLPNMQNRADVTLCGTAGGADTASSSPLRIGVVLSGGQAPGGHNVIAGVYDYAKQLNPSSRVRDSRFAHMTGRVPGSSCVSLCEAPACP